MNRFMNMPSFKYFTQSIFLIFFLIFNLGLNTKIYSQTRVHSANQNITIDHSGGDVLTYCIWDPVDVLTGQNPNNDNFSGPGITDATAGDGTATFNPAVAGAGNFNIRYQNHNFSFTVVGYSSVTLDPFPGYCSNSPAFTLSGGNPVVASGKYYVNGVLATTFNPAAMGAGTYSVKYTVSTGACIQESPAKNIVVNAISVTFNQPVTPVCSYNAPVDLTSFVSPAGGTFSGPGIVGNTFDPSKVIPPGTFTIRYTYTDPVTACTAYAERNITVTSRPVINIAGLIVKHCEYDAFDAFTYSPVSGAGGTGVLSGNGITDLGGGNASFNSLVAGLGYHNINYIYTDVNGCTTSQDVTLSVGTDIKITGLDLNYCENEAPVNFNYSHWDTDPINPPVLPHTLTITAGGSGLTDNGNGSATFIPSTVGSYIITYEYSDNLTCIDHVEKSVQVLPNPVADFSGLNATLQYCYGAPDVTLSGNQPGGSFTGPAGSIVNIGGGQATFEPSALSAGGPYPITYSYTNSSGCTDTETKNVTITALPIDYAVSGSGSYCQGSGGLTITLFDSDPLINYQLYKNGIIEGALVGGTGSAITWPGKTAGTYTVAATDAITGCTKTMSGSAGIFELAQATITSMPVDETVCEGGTAIFNVAATGQNLTYAWTKNGAAVGVNSNVLALNGLTIADDGHLVVCTVTSTCPVGFSSSTAPAKLEVESNSTMTSHPSDIVKCTGSSHTFTVAATGTNNNYQWKKGATDIVETPGKYLNVNTPNITILNISASDAGNYICYVNGNCGPEIQSNPASLQVTEPIVITAQPVSMNACEGSDIAFSTVATPAGLTYQWHFDNGGGYVPIGINSPSLPINGVTAANKGTYYCTILNSCGASTNTNPATLTIPVTTSITINPAGGTRCEGTNFNLSATAVGESLQYKWYKDGALLTNNAVVSNSSTANLTLTGVTLGYTGNYNVKVTGTCGVQTSAPAAVLTVNQLIVVNNQPVGQTVCSGSDATFSINISGDVLSYQWQFNTVDIPGANSDEYTVTGATAVNAGNYRCRITSLNCGNIYSDEATLNINPTTIIVTQPTATKNACIGNNVSFSVAAAGVGLTYQWYKDGTSLGVGFNNSTISLNNISSADAACYTCKVTGTCGPSMISQPAVLTVDIPSVISNHPQSQSVCLNSNHQLTVLLSAGTNPAYQWFFDNELDGTFIPVAGGNCQILSIGPFTSANAGDYYCNVTNGCGTVASQKARLTLVSLFSITSQPSDANVCENGSATFSVIANQPGLAYQWMKNGVDIPGAVNSSIVVNSIALADDGTNFSCEVSNNCGTTISNSAKLSVSTSINITQQPQSGTGCPGQTYNIIIIASGSNLSYQWFRVSSGLIAGAINSNYSIAAFAAGDADTYYCVVTNGCGTVTSGSSIISIGADIAITDPLSLSLCAGADAAFSIVASGTNPQYEWRKNDIPIIDDGRIVGSGTNSLTINNIIAGDEGTYNIVVTGTCGLQKTSAGAYVDVKAPPSITIGPEPRTICSGGTTSFSITATGDLPLTYSWQKDGVSINPLVNPSAATSTLNIPGAATGGIYRCLVTNTCGSVTSTSAELVIEENINISSQPSSITRCDGNNATFTVGVTGPTDMVLQWYKDGLPLTEDIRVNGVNLSTLSINNITSADEGSYWCEISGYCGNTITNSAILTVHDRIVITQQPQSVTICPAGTLNLNVIVTGTVINYQWKRNGVNVGTNNPTYSVSPFTAGLNDGNYTCEMTNICETVISDFAVVTAGSPTAATISGNLTICEGTNANFTMTATGSNLVYQWYRNSTPMTDDARIGGSRTNNLTINAITSADGGTYQCDVSGTCGFDNDNTAVLTVQENITIGVDPASISVLLGNTATFTVVESGSTIGYQWYKGITLLSDLAGEISGATTSTLNIINAQFTDAGDYKCVINGSCGSTDSKSATLTVLTTSAITTQPATLVSLCENESLTLSITTSGSGHTYQWKQDNNNLSDGGDVSGTLTSSLTVNNTTSSNIGAYTCVVDGVEISSAAIVTINPNTVINVNPAGATKCEGDMHIFSVSAEGAGLTYQWYKNNMASPIALATSNEFTINSIATTDNGTYFCVVTGACGVRSSSGATLTVNANLVVNSQPVGTSICQGSSTTLFFDVTGSGLTYLWKKNGQPIIDAAITGTTTDKLQISGGVPSYSGNYTCTVSGTCGGSITSNIATVTVDPTTVITTQPIGRTKCEGDGVTFTVEASGTNLVYNWHKDGVSLGLPGNPILTIAGLIKATHEGIYTCEVTGTCGTTIISEPAVLSVNRNTSIGLPVLLTNPICEGTSTTITIAATGDGLSYLWKKNGQPVTGTNFSGITSSELVISNALTIDAGVFTCTVTGACGSSLTSSNALLIVNHATGIVSQPSNFTRCAGDEVLFTVAADGDNLLYRWKKGGASGTDVTDGLQASGASITGAATVQLKIAGITITESDSYVCIVTGTCGSINSTPAILTVNVPVQIIIEPLSLTTICQANSTEISVTSDGTVSEYKWKKNGVYIIDGGNVSGVNTNKILFSNTSILDAGFYSCEISGACNTVNTQSAELRVNPTTQITLHPSGATLCEGDNIQFMVSAIGVEPLIYQWKKNNVNIAGANNSTLTINGIVPGDAGAYTCLVSGASCGQATSNPASLTVNPKISIAVQPVHTTVCEGNVAIISLNATGSNVSYRWKYNNAYMSDNVRITGTNTNELKIASATNADEGIYKCEINSACDTRESNSVILTVNDSPIISVQPVNQTVVQGSGAFFNISADGIITGYQWLKNGLNLIDGVNISGSNTSVLALSNITGSDAGSYSCNITGTCGTVISGIGILAVNIPVTITSPLSQTRCSGESVSFSVTASGTVQSYQWTFNGSNITDGVNTSGAQTSTLVITAVDPSHAGTYSCIVTGNYNIANSVGATLTINEPVTITIHPETGSVCEGDQIVLEVIASGNGLTYQWEKNNIALAPNPSTAGINSSLLVITNVNSANAGSYRCTITNTCKTETTNPAVITINPTVSIVTQPVNDTRCEGQTTSFSVIANGVNSQYQWYKNGMAITNTTRITGANTSNLVINNLVSTDQGNYSCFISDNCSSMNSATAVLTVKKVVVVFFAPSDKTVCEGENSFFEVNTTGDNLLYQWQKDGVNLSDAGNIFGSNSSILIIQNTTIANQGVYRCIITGYCNNIFTNPSSLSVNALPGIAGVISGDNVVCQGEKNVLFVAPVISNATSYLWDLPYGASIAGGNGTRSIQVDFSKVALSGTVSVHGVNGCGNGTESPLFGVTVNPTPQAGAGPDQTLCANATTFNADLTAFGTWTKLSGLATISNPNLPNSAVTNLGQGNNIFVWTVSENGCVAKDTVIISNKMVNVDAGTDQTICSLTTTLNANTPVSGLGTWSIFSGGAIFSSGNDPRANVINLSRGPNVLRWSINNGGCVSQDEITIINDLPTNSNAGADAIILTDNYTLNGNNPAIGTGHWTLLSGSATIVNPNQYNTSLTDLGIGENSFKWTISNNLCYSQDVAKIINYTPTLTDAGPGQTLCVNHTILQGTIPNYGTGQWSVAAGSGTFVDPYKFDTEVINIGKGPNIYRWTIYEYEITFDDVTIINNSPSTANAGIDQRLCVLNTTLAGNNPLVGTGIWTLTGGSGIIANPSIYNSAVSNLGNGSNTFRWTITNNGCSSYDEVTIKNDQPTSADAGADQVTCDNTVTLYPNTPTIGTGEWSVIQGAASFTGNNAYNLGRGDNLLKWTIANNGCSNSDIVLITSNKPSVSNTGEDKSICINSIFLPGNTPVYGTGAWTILSGSATFENAALPQSKVTNLAIGQNRFRWTITYNGCTSSSEVNINYNYIQSEAGENQTLCQSNALLSASDPGIGTGQWSVVGGSGSANFLNPNQPNTEVTNLDKGINILRWTITNSGCVSYDDVVIINNTPSTAYAGSDRSVCGEEILLNANNPGIGTGEWTVLSGSANIENPVQYNSRISNLSKGQNVLRWTITNQNCISSDEVVISNNQPTNIEAGTDQYICSDLVQLYSTAPVGGSGRWSISEGSATFEDNTLFNSKAYNLERGENKLVWTVTIASCSNSDTVVITNNLPSTPNAGPDQDICSNTALMSANQPLIGTGRWSIVSGSASFENLTSPNTHVTNIGNGANILRWSITNGSCVLFDEVLIRNGLPTVAYAGEDRAICNTTVNLLATPPITGTGSWSVVSGSGVFTYPGNHDSQITDLGFGANTLRWTTENGRCRTTDDVIIKNNLAEVYAGPDQIVYSPDIRLVGNIPSSGTGQWVILAGRGTMDNPSVFNVNISNLGGGANTFIWTINNDGCIASDDVVITYHVLPKADFSPLPAIGCAPLTVSFINNSIGGSPFLWDFGDGTTSNATNTNHTYTVPGNYNVKLAATGPDGMILYKDTVVIVQKIPVAQFEITPDTAYIPGPSVHFFNLSEDIDSLLWDFGDGNTSTEINPTHIYATEGSNDVTLNVWSGSRCYDALKVSNAVFVERAGTLKCPNAFTPNLNGSSDGLFNQNDFSNDVFHCFCEGILDYHLEVYNRFGIILFKSNDINKGWDGYLDGKLLQEGSYVYKVYGKFNNGGSFSHVGNIVLIY
jgi:gliding motility-associated-like protein